MNQSRHRSADTPSAVELIEESVHLLRRARPGTLAIYYGGSAPFAIGLAFFWARTTWFRPTNAAVAAGALGLVALFTLMKAAHAEFCGRLLAQRLGEATPAWSWARGRRLATAQLRLQAWGLLALPMALVVAAPFGWVYAYFQSASVIGESEKLGAEARAQAQLWPAQNHVGQLLLSLLAAVAWINLAAAFWLVPWLANRLLGIENLFGFSGWWLLNTTFLASVSVLTWLAVDPLVKAFFTLRVFHGRARRTGEDLRVELGSMRRAGRALAVAALAALLLIFTVPAGFAANTGANQTIPPAALDAAIDRVLAGDDFQWRLRPLPAEENAAQGNADGFFARLANTVANWSNDFFHWLGRLLEDLVRWLRRLFLRQNPADIAASAASGAAALQFLLWMFAVLVAGLLIGVVVLAWRRSRKLRRTTLTAEPVTVAVPDLQSENTQAGQLPVDGWLDLAREQLARSEWRLAWRALHLALLARLAADGLVSLAKFKTNLDYERELRRRAITRQEIVTVFAARRRAFEAVWYGREPAAETAAREWLAELEQGPHA